ncbi:MAG: diacylglycerol kinase family lipid kinase [Flavobacteriales bacterium]|nr:diacylglycerol kinase family lipid kinase [Flavobacteriales bacterium]
MKKTVSLIVHGHRKLSEKTRETLALLQGETMLQIKIYKTKGPGDASEIAIKASKHSDVIVAVGGDGTCNEVINGLMIKPKDHIIFGVIPNGTGNDFVRNFPPFDPYTFVVGIIENSVKRIDLGKIQFGKATRYFLNVADIGFGAKVIDTLNKQRSSGVSGKFSYNLAILRSFISYRKPELKIRSEHFEFEGKSLMIAFSNGTTFGSGLQIFPGAKLDSGKLGLTIIGDVSLGEYAKNLGNLRKGRRIDHPQVKYYEFEKLHVHTTLDDLYVETDGEIAGRSSITVEVIPSAIQIIA